MKRTSRESSGFEQLLRPLTDRFIAAIEAEIEAQTKAMLAEWLSRGDKTPSRHAALDPRRSEAVPQADSRPVVESAAPVSSPATLAPSAPEAQSPSPARFRSVVRTRRVRATPPKIAAPPADPRDAERTAELNRLRSILRPTRDEPPLTEPPAATRVEAPAGEPQDRMKILEEKVRDGMVFLSDLPPVHCAATIAAWAGQARLYQTDARTRFAAQLLLEKLRGLARAMDAGFIEALDPSWTTPDWEQYVKMKEAALTEPGPAVATRETDAPRPAGNDYGDIWR